MTEVAIEDAAARLERLIQDVRNGEEVVITKGRQPVARLVAIVPVATRTPGTGKDLILRIADDFDAPLGDFRDYS